MFRLRLYALLVVVNLAALGLAFAQGSKITLHGKLFTHPEIACSFFLDGEDESESIQIVTFSEGSYICEYLAGSNAHGVVVTFAPAPK